VLADRGVSSDRLAVVGFGDQHPVASNATVEGRNANRRVTVVILSTASDQHTEPGWMPNTNSSGGGTTGQPTAAAAPAAAPTAAATPAGATPAAPTPSGTVPAR